jgi:hypothetical protein
MTNDDLKTEIKWIALFYDPYTCEYRTKMCESEKDAINCRGFGDYAGHNKIECVVPREKWSINND